MLSVIAIKFHLVNVFNNNRTNSKQTLILPVHIKSQLSYAATTEKFCVRKLEKLEESQAKEEYQKNANGFTIMAKLSWRSTKLSPGAGFLSIFCPGAVISQKFSARGAGNLTTLKKSPGGQPGGMLVLGIDWCITWRHLSLKLKIRALWRYKKLSYDFWFKTLRDSKVRASKDHGKKFRGRLTSSFSRIVHLNTPGPILFSDRSDSAMTLFSARSIDLDNFMNSVESPLFSVLFLDIRSTTEMSFDWFESQFPLFW